MKIKTTVTENSSIPIQLMTAERYKQERNLKRYKHMNNGAVIHTT